MPNSQQVIVPNCSSSTMVYPIATMIPTTLSRNIPVTVHNTNEQQSNNKQASLHITQVSTSGLSFSQAQLSYAKAASNIDSSSRTSRSSANGIGSNHVFPMTIYSRSTPVITTSPTYTRKNNTNSNSRNSSPSAKSRNSSPSATSRTKCRQTVTAQTKSFNDSLEKTYSSVIADPINNSQSLKAPVVNLVTPDNAWSRKRNDVVFLSDSSDDAGYSKKANFRLDPKQTTHTISSDEGD